MSGEAVLTLTAVSKTYPGPPAVTALRGVDLTVARGDFLAVTGPSGSGKSSLLNVLGLLDTAFTGTYRVHGTDVTALRPRQKDALRANVFGFVFQASHLLLTRSVAANVALSLTTAGVPRAQRRDAVERALETVGVAHRWDAAGRDLSGGERQRVALARALATRPSILLADEPTGNLDTVNTEAIIELLGAVRAAGTTVVVITHTEAVARAASRRARIIDGELTCA